MVSTDSLKSTQSISLAARGGLLLALAAVLVAGPLIGAHALLAARERRASFAAQETLLAAALAHAPGVETIRAQIGGPEPGASDAGLNAGPNSASPAWLRALDGAGARVYWAGLVRADGVSIELRPSALVTGEEIAKQIRFDQRGPVWRSLGTVGRGGRKLRLLTIPLGTPAARSDTQTAEPAAVLAALIECEPDTVFSWGWPFVLLASPLLTVVLLYMAFQRLILRPIQGFTHSLAAVPLELAELSVLGSAPAELKTLAESIGEARAELKKWRAAAHNLERSLETKVDAKTKRVEQALRQAEREADTDPLTGLGNRRALLKALPQWFAEQKANGGDLIVVVFDVDNFKLLNDLRGHQAGDELLQFLGGLIKAAVHKPAGLAFRTGGDEFILLLRETTPRDAAALAERLAAFFQQRVKTLPTVEPPPSLSAGVASLRRHHSRTAEELLHMGDEAMYFAKRGGRAAALADEVGGPVTKRR